MLKYVFFDIKFSELWKELSWFAYPCVVIQLQTLEGKDTEINMFLTEIKMYKSKRAPQEMYFSLIINSFDTDIGNIFFKWRKSKISIWPLGLWIHFLVFYAIFFLRWENLFKLYK